MRQVIIILILYFSFYNCLAQKNNVRELNTWIKENNVKFGSPTTPKGYIRFLDCGEIIAFKKKIGDTLVIYSRSHTIAEDIKKLSKSILDKDWNVLRYPKKIQKNQTILIQNMRKHTFLIKSDTIYLLDEYDKKKSDTYLKILKRYFDNKITKEKFKRLAQENETKDYGYTPKFKIIYFKGIFYKSNTYSFSKKENFRKEYVSLINSWIENEIKYFEINLNTHTAGKYVISEDFIFINTETCK